MFFLWWLLDLFYEVVAPPPWVRMWVRLSGIFFAGALFGYVVCDLEHSIVESNNEWHDRHGLPRPKRWFERLERWFGFEQPR